MEVCRTITFLLLFNCFSPALIGETERVSFSLPPLAPGTVLRRSFDTTSNYQKVIKGESGPGMVITFPPLEHTTTHHQTFRLAGRVDPSVQLRISGRPVLVYPSGSFVELVKLKMGKNAIPIDVSDLDGLTKYTLKLERKEPPWPPTGFNPFPRPRQGRIIKPRTALQLLPSRTRWLTGEEGTVLKVVGRSDPYYQVELGSGLTAWVSIKNVELEGLFPAQPFSLGSVIVEEGNDRVLFEAQTAVAARVKYISPSRLQVVFYNAVVDTETVNLGNWEGDCRWEQEADGRAAVYLSGPLHCHRWRLFWKDGGFRLEWKDKPLKKETVIVLIDPGHGGEDAGAVSPLGIEEKEANLLLAREVARRLTEAGVICHLSREKDVRVGLNQRVDLAREKTADLLLSLHFNSISEGKDPREKSGCMVFYYNPPSRQLAGLIYGQLKRLGLKGNGVRWQSLAVIRPPDLIGVLAEVAYLSHPEDEERLLKPGFIKKTAAAISAGVIDYLNRGGKGGPESYFSHHSRVRDGDG